MFVRGKVGFAIALAFALIFFIPMIQAQTEYINEVKAYPWDWRPFFDAYEPRVACDNSNSTCVMIFYDNDPFNTGIHIIYSNDGFNTDKRFGGKITSCQFDLTFPMNYSLQYDIVYNPTNSKFYILAPTEASGRCALRTVGIYQWDTVNLLNTTYQPLASDCNPATFKQWIDFSPVGILGKNTNTPEAVIFCGRCLSSTWVYPELFLQRYYVWNGSLIQNNFIGSNPCPACCPMTQTNFGFYYTRGMTEKDTNNQYRFYILYNWNDAGGHNFTGVYNTIGTFPVAQSGIWYYLDNYLYYKSVFNASLHVDEGIYKIWTNFATYPYSAIPYYIFDNVTNNEVIPYTSILRTSFETVYAFERRYNAGSFDKGLYYASTSLFPVFSHSKYIDPLTLEEKPPAINSILTTIQCPDTNYSISGIGEDRQLSTVCLNNMTIILDANNYYPASYTKTGINIPEGCNYYSINSKFLIKSYSVPITVKDYVTKLPIANANITIDGTLYTANANGTATVTVYPLMNTSFAVNTAYPCFLYLTGTGTPRGSNIRITKTDYQTYENPSEQFATVGTGGSITFSPFRVIELTPTGAVINIRVFTSDGLEPPLSNAVATITGANKTYWVYENERRLQNTAIVFPAQFILIDNRSTYSIVVNLSFADKIYTNFLYNGLEYNNITISNNGTYTFWFILNQTATNMDCSNNLDCVQTFCLDNKFYKSSGCQNDTCSYTSMDCVNCDELIGCYEITTTTPCNTTLDCSSRCTGNYTSEFGLCGSDGFCKTKRVNCGSRSGCHNTTGICWELEGCYFEGEVRYRFLISAEVQEWRGILPNRNVTSYLDYDFYCGITNFNTRTCLEGVRVPYTAQFNVVTTYPDNWKYTSDSLYHYFTDVSLFCDASCNVTWEFCPNGCNQMTGFCSSIPSSFEGSIKNYLDTGRDILNSIFPDIGSKTIASMIFILIIVVMVMYGLNKVNSTSNWQIGITIAIIMTLSLSFVGWIDILVTILFVIGAGLILVRNIFWTSGG